MFRPIRLLIPFSGGELDSDTVFPAILVDVTDCAGKLNLPWNPDHDLRIYIDLSIHAQTHTFNADVVNESDQGGAGIGSGLDIYFSDGGAQMSYVFAAFMCRVHS